MKIIFNLIPKTCLLKRCLNNLVQSLLISDTFTFVSKGNVSVDRLGKWIWTLENHSNMFTHFINIDITCIDIDALIKDLSSNLSNINRIIHSV